jgi:hypothetical protein
VDGVFRAFLAGVVEDGESGASSYSVFVLRFLLDGGVVVLVEEADILWLGYECDRWDTV